MKQEIIDVFGPDSALGGVASLKELGLDEFPLTVTNKIMKRGLEGPVAEFLKLPVQEIGVGAVMSGQR